MSRALFGVLVVCAAATHASESETDLRAVLDDTNAARLFSACSKMSAAIQELGDDAAEIGLAWDAVRNVVELRLRSARLFSSEPTVHYVFVRVSVFRDAFSVRVSLERWLPDTGLDHQGFVTVWQDGLLGFHGGDQRYVLGVVEQQLDAFLVAYLRANEAYCSDTTDAQG